MNLMATHTPEHLDPQYLTRILRQRFADGPFVANTPKGMHPVLTYAPQRFRISHECLDYDQYLLMDRQWYCDCADPEAHWSASEYVPLNREHWRAEEDVTHRYRHVD
jgi:hypothetical protein